jgi:hypothetical protein
MSNTAIEIIQTSQAPDAKPVGVSKILTDTFQSIIEVPTYLVPEETFGGSNVQREGVAEIITPMLICNTSSIDETVSVRMYRHSSNMYFDIAKDIPVPRNDILALPLNGQFIYTGDVLEARSNVNGFVNITISYTVGEAERDDVI